MSARSPRARLPRLRQAARDRGSQLAPARRSGWPRWRALPPGGWRAGSPQPFLGGEVPVGVIDVGVQPPPAEMHSEPLGQPSMPAAGASKVVPGAELSKTALGATWRPIQLQYGGNQEMPIFVGGEGGILTHEPGEGSPVFKSQDRRAAGPDTHTSACFIGFLKTFRSSFFRVFTTRAARSAASGSPDWHALACPCAEPARSCTLRCESPRTLFLVEGLPIRGSPMNLLFVTTPDSRESRMDLHQNARLTPRCRELLVGE